MVSYTLEEIFEYLWSVELERVVDSKSPEELILELKEIENETKKLAEDF